jgi:hypothetical protein
MSGYKKKTPLLGIPVSWYGDRIIPEMEMKKALIIENMLMAGMAGVREAVFDDGSYRLEKETDETYLVKLSATGASPSVKGMVGGAYFHAPSVVEWKGLKKGRKYHLYIRATSRVFEDCSAVRAFAEEHATESGGLLVAVVDLGVAEPKVDAHPDGKLYSMDLARHMSDIENPHGRRLYQEELVVTERLILRKEGEGQPVIQIEVEDDDIREFPAAAFAGAVAELAGRRIEIVDFVSGGPEGVVLRVPPSENPKARIFYAHVQRVVKGSFEGQVGEVGVGYMGEDSNVDENLEFAVYNTGVAGIEMKAVVYCG